MKFVVHRVQPALQPYIDLIWSMSAAGCSEPERQRVYPTGAMELVIHLGGRELSFYDGESRQTVRIPLLAGPYSKPFLIDPAEFTNVLGVRFRPGAARLFFPIPAHELHNTDIALADLNEHEASRLLDQLHSAAKPSDVLQRYLLDKLKHPLHPVVEHVVHELTRYPGVRTIKTIQADTGLGHTRFTELFRDHVGMTPKLFCRIQRFRQVLNRIEAGQPVNWAGVAADCGYFDQPHLIRDFRAFSGLTPAEFSTIQSLQVPSTIGA